MFKTFMGPVEDTAAVVYLRPETAQGIYVNFLNVQQATRQKVPFGIAQIGKAFRNEITPGNFIFRTREFEQMEMQFFVEPGTDMTWFEFWKAERMKWHQELGLAPERLMFHQHEKHELAHYARAAFDVQFDFGGTLGFQEIEGVHNRGDFDLTAHQNLSGKKLEYFDQPNNRRFTPYVVETSVGADRTTLAVLVNAYREEKVEGEEEGRTVLGIHPSLAPIKAGIFPLVKKDGMPEMAEKLAKELRPHFPVFYDESGAIGRRYRRQDEVGYALVHHRGRRFHEGWHGDHPGARFIETGARPRGRVAHDHPGSAHEVSASELDRLRRDGEAMSVALSREFYENGAGLKGTAELQPIYAKYPRVLGDEALAQVREAFAGAAEGSEEKRGARLLLDWQVEGMVSRELAALDEREIAWESSAAVTLPDGRVVPYQQLAIDIANTMDRERPTEPRSRAIGDRVEGTRADAPRAFPARDGTHGEAGHRIELCEHVRDSVRRGYRGIGCTVREVPARHAGDVGRHRARAGAR